MAKYTEATYCLTGPSPVRSLPPVRQEPYLSKERCLRSLPKSEAASLLHSSSADRVHLLKAVLASGQTPAQQGSAAKSA